MELSNWIENTKKKTYLPGINFYLNSVNSKKKQVEFNKILRKIHRTRFENESK